MSGSELSERIATIRILSVLRCATDARRGAWSHDAVGLRMMSLEGSIQFSESHRS